MKTKIVKMAVFKNIRHGFLTTADARIYGDCSEHMRVSNVVEVEFELITDTATQDAIKAKSIKAAQSKIEAAQVELDQLLREK